MTERTAVFVLYVKTPYKKDWEEMSELTGKPSAVLSPQTFECGLTVS